MEMPIPSDNKTGIRSWVIIFVLAVLFVAWGLFIFFTVGDKGPPSWNFGVVRDIPGESPYSTHSPSRGKEIDPESQHISQNPSKAFMEAQKEKP
jgi:hypothetical protein